MKKDNKKNFYITTPIYYASGDIHIGHTYCCTVADSIARYKRLAGYNVRFMTGSDEHGQKIAEKARAANKTPKEFVDIMVDNFKKVWNTMNISYDYFVRTTDKNHIECVQKVFSKLLKDGIIYLGEYKGWYCTPDEAFWSDSQVVVENGIHYCPECHREVKYESEPCYFFKTSLFVDKLLKFYKDHPKFCPKDKVNEMVNTFIKNGLEDLCITRTSFSWGVQVKEDPKHVVYVWIDALLNYVSALGLYSKDETLLNTFWNKNSEIIQLAGRDITRFHVIYWPMILYALDLRLPDRVLVHGLLVTRNGVKLGKSLGNAPSPYPLVERYSVDALRYYLVREMNFMQDGTFTPSQFVDRYNADLANNYGNLINRTLSMINKYFEGVIPSASEKDIKNSLTKKLIKDAKEKVKNYFSLMDDYDLTLATSMAMEIFDLGNKYIDSMAPWDLSKNNKIDELKETLYFALELVRIGSILLQPVIPTKAKEALELIKAKKEFSTFDSLESLGSLGNNKLGEITPLFPRLKKEEEIAFLTDLIDKK